MSCFSWFRSAVLAENRPARSFRFHFKELQTEECLKKQRGKPFRPEIFGSRNAQFPNIYPEQSVFINLLLCIRIGCNSLTVYIITQIMQHHNGNGTTNYLHHFLNRRNYRSEYCKRHQRNDASDEDD